MIKKISIATIYIYIYIYIYKAKLYSGDFAFVWHGNHLAIWSMLFTGNLNVIMIVSGLEFCCHFSYCFHTVLYTLSSYIIYRDALQGNDYHNF